MMIFVVTVLPDPLSPDTSMDWLSPKIAILHGYPSGSYDYYATIQIWTTQYRVVVHDHLGLGLSDKPEEYSYSLIEQADMALALWQKLGLKEVHLLGHDYGTNLSDTDKWDLIEYMKSL